jgi:hypothetical protein
LPKPCEFLRFGGIDVTKPWFGDTQCPKLYELTWSGRRLFGTNRHWGCGPFYPARSRGSSGGPVAPELVRCRFQACSKCGRGPNFRVSVPAGWGWITRVLAWTSPRRFPGFGLSFGLPRSPRVKSGPRRSRYSASNRVKSGPRTYGEFRPPTAGCGPRA